MKFGMSVKSTSSRQFLFISYCNLSKTFVPTCCTFGGGAKMPGGKGPLAGVTPPVGYGMGLCWYPLIPNFGAACPEGGAPVGGGALGE